MKMFPEYVEKYEQMLSEQPACDSKESPASANLVERRKVPSSDGKTMATGEETSRQEALADPRNQRKSFLARGLTPSGDTLTDRDAIISMNEDKGSTAEAISQFIRQNYARGEM